LEAAVTLELEKMNSFVVAKIDQINVYDSETFEKYDTINVKLRAADSREPN